MPSARPLAPDFFLQDTLTVARKLLGMHLVRVVGSTRRVGRIVETEAYLGPEDRAAHSWRGRTPRTEVMFGPPGRAYVYLVYGMWNCLNVVTAAQGVPHAVLLRAIEPLEGIEQRASGPGLLCRAMDVDRQLNGVDLRGAQLRLEAPAGRRPVRIARSPRIGVEYAGEWAARPWRFFERDSPFVSGRAPTRARR